MSDQDKTESATQSGAADAPGLNQSVAGEPGEMDSSRGSVAPEGGRPEEAAASAPAAAESASPPAARGRAVNQTELAAILGVSDVTLWQWQKLGMPVLERNLRGQSNLYDTAAVVEWKIAEEVRKAGGPETQKDRLARLQGDRLEMEIAAERRELIPAGEIEPAWSSIATAVKQALRPLGVRLASVLESTPGVDEKRKLIDEEVHEVLSKLATYELQPGGGEPGTPGDGVLRPAPQDRGD